MINFQVIKKVQIGLKRDIEFQKCYTTSNFVHWFQIVKIISVLG